MIFLQILNIYIIKDKLQLEKNIKNNFFDFIDIYEKNNYKNLARYLRGVLSIYENYPSNYADLDFKSLKSYTDFIVNEAF